MSETSVFVFDEIFESMVGTDQLVKLRSLDAEIHVIAERCKVSEYEPVNAVGTRKILCINPDFVDWHFSADEYKRIPGLDLIISFSDNISWLDTSFADSHGVRYTSLEHLTTEYSAVAEYAITMMTSLARNIPLLTRDEFPLDFAHDFVKYQGLDLAGKTAGIIGLGNIGSAIAERCAGVGMNVVYWSRSQKNQSYEYREIEDLLQISDVIFPTLKPNAETKQLLPNSRLELIKRDAIVVGVVGELIDNTYLVQRTEDTTLFGFGFGADPSTYSNYSGNVWAIPDYAWATRNNMQASYDQCVDLITKTLTRPNRA